MSKPDVWMPLYVADYLADTSHLNAAEHGAYLLLIMHYWRAGVLPLSDGQLLRIARMTASQWEESSELVLSFFERTEAGYRHARIDSELAKAREKSAKARASANEMHRRRSANAERRQKPSTPNAEPSLCSSQSPSQAPIGANADDDLRARAAAIWPLKQQVLELTGALDDPSCRIDAGRVDAWIADGADPELDILPTVKRVMAKRGSQGPPKTLNYFDQAIADSVKTRTAPLPEGQHVPSSRPSLQHDRDTTGFAARKSGWADAAWEPPSGSTGETVDHDRAA